MVSMAHAAAKGGVVVHALYTQFFKGGTWAQIHTEKMAHRDGMELKATSVSQGMLKSGNKPTGTRERTRNHNLSLRLLRYFLFNFSLLMSSPGSLFFQSLALWRFEG